MDDLVAAHEALQEATQSMQRGELQAALDPLRDCLQVFLMRGDPYNACTAYSHLGDLHRLMGTAIDSYSCYDKAGQLATAQLCHFTEVLASSLLGRGILSANSGKLLEGYLMFSQADDLYRSVASPRASEAQRFIAQIQTHVGPQLTARFDNCWKDYQRLLAEAQQRRQKMLPVNVHP